MEHIRDALEYSHRERDPRDNVATSLPEDESLRVPCIWAFEAFTPTQIDNLWTVLARLRGLDVPRFGRESAAEMVEEWRLQVSGGGWVNLGFIVGPDKYRPLHHALSAPLPSGIDALHATIMQPLPSTTILRCQFLLDPQAASALEAPFREPFSTYAQNAKDGVVQFISVEHQRVQAVDAMRAYLRAQCTEWIVEFFPGLFHSSLGAAGIPTAELMLFSRIEEFESTATQATNAPYPLRILNPDSLPSIWKSSEIANMYLKLENASKREGGRAVLFGNADRVLLDKNLAAYGSDRHDQIAHWCHYLDHTFGAWILSLIAGRYINDLAFIRDEYGSLKFDPSTETLATARSIEIELSALTRNAIPFAQELAVYCNRKALFMHEIFEFNPVHRWRGEERKLFAEMREGSSQWLLTSGIPSRTRGQLHCSLDK
jgi:hypothetical protein